MSAQTEQWIIEACFCHSILARKPSGDALFKLQSGYGFWRLSKVIQSDEKTTTLEIIEVFHGGAVVFKNGYQSLVLNPSRWRTYRDWNLHCLMPDGDKQYNQIVDPASRAVIKIGTQDAILRIWYKAKNQLESVDGAIHNSNLRILGILKCDSVFLHNAAFQVLGEIMQLPLPAAWFKYQPGIDSRLVNQLLAQQQNILLLQLKNPASASPMSETNEVKKLLPDERSVLVPK